MGRVKLQNKMAAMTMCLLKTYASLSVYACVLACASLSTNDIMRKINWKKEVVDTSGWNEFPSGWLAGLSLRDRGRSLTIRRESCSFASEGVSSGGSGIVLGWRCLQALEVFRARPTGRRPQGRPRTPWRDYISLLAWECLGIPQEELEGVIGERDVWPISS